MSGDAMDPTPTIETVRHELNNVLTAILGYAEIVHAEAVEGSVEVVDAEQILAATRRAIELADLLAELTQQESTG